MDKNCLECGKALIIKLSRDKERKKFCSHSCCIKYYHKLGKYPPPPRPNKETIIKAAITRSLRMKQGLIPKPPHHKIKQVYFCPDCGKQVSRKYSRCWLCYRKSKLKVGICKQCGKQFTRLLGSSYKMVFCSAECRNTYSNKVVISCAYCNKPITLFPSLIKTNNYCSRSCMGKAARLVNGSNSPAYIDGRTPFRKLIKSSAKYRDWQIAVFQKYNYKCSNCKADKSLHVHHIKPFSVLLDNFYKYCKEQKVNINDLNIMLNNAYSYNPFWDVTNGIILCRNCHQKKHPEVNLCHTR